MVSKSIAGERSSGLDVLPKLESVTLQEQIYLKLKEALILGQFAPGQVLTIRDLAGAFGTSPMPVRGALFRLVSERALELAGKRSMRVPQLSTEMFDDITDVRKILEGSAAERAAKLIDEDTLAFVRNANEKMKNACRKMSVPLALECNRDFHFAIYNASGSETLVKTIEPLWLQHGAYFPLILREYSQSKGKENVHHDALVAALARRDHKSARKALEADIEDSRMWYRQTRQSGDTNERSSAASR